MFWIDQHASNPTKNVTNLSINIYSPFFLSQIIHLLIHIPRMYYEHFLSPIDHQEKNIDAIDVILRYLHNQLETLMSNRIEKIDVLELLILMCQSNRIVRRYCRGAVLSISDENVQSLGEK